MIYILYPFLRIPLIVALRFVYYASKKMLANFINKIGEGLASPKLLGQTTAVGLTLALFYQ